MSLDLHAKCKARLLEVLVAGLPVIKVNHGKYVDRRSAVILVLGDQVLPQGGELRDRLIEYIDEFPLTSFIVETLGEELDLGEYISDAPPMTLPQIERYADVPALAARLIESFDSLPWTYQLTFALPQALSGLLPSHIDVFPLGPAVRLVRATEKFAQEFPLTAEDKRRQRRLQPIQGMALLSLSDETPVWKTDTLYLQVLTDGFVPLYGGTSTALRAERLVRAFCGLGIAVRLFSHQYRFRWGPTAKHHFYVHRKKPDGTWCPEWRLDVNDNTNRGLLDLEMHTLDGKLVIEEHKAMWALDRLRDMAAAFSAEHKSEPILRASQWLLDSHAGRDELLSFVQAMVVLEILLGDKKVSDEIGIGELLR